MESIRCTLDSFEETIQQLLEEEVTDKKAALKRGINKTVKDMAEETRQTAPKSQLDRSGRYASKIDWREEPKETGHAARWYVKAPDYRLTHLLANGHVTRNGGRSQANPFLHDAVAHAEAALEENIRREAESQ